MKKKVLIIGLVVIAVIAAVIIVGMNSRKNIINEDSMSEELPVDISAGAVTKAYNKVKAAADYIYKYADFDKDNIPEELKLRLAYTYLEGKDLGYDAGNVYFQQTGQSYCYSVDTFAEAVKEIFGEGTTVENAPFYATENAFSSGEGHPRFKYNPDLDRFETNFEFGGAIRAYVAQRIDRASTKDNELYLFVTPIFYKNNFESDMGELFDGYANFDYSTEEFSNLIAEDVAYIENKYQIEKQEYNLNTYKYTFEKQGNDYFLTGLEKVK